MPSRTSLGGSYDRSAPRRPINLSLNTNLVPQVREVTPNLSATVETLPGDYLQSARRGFLSDEFSTL